MFVFVVPYFLDNVTFLFIHFIIYWTQIRFSFVCLSLKHFLLFCSKRSLTSATPDCTKISQHSQLYEDANSFTHYESTSKFIKDNENTVVPSEKLSSSGGVSPIYSPTYHLLSNAASILRHDGLDKGGSLLCVNDLWQKV